MGNKPKKAESSLEAEMTNPDIVLTESYIKDTEEELYVCCGQKISYRKSKQIWKLRFEANIKELMEYYSWPTQILKIYKHNKNLERTQYLKEINEIKYAYLNAKATSKNRPQPIASINIDHIIQNTVLFKKQVLKSMIKEIPRKVSTNDKKNLKKSILIPEDSSEKEQKKRIRKLPNISFMDESITSIFSPHRKQDLNHQSKQELKLFIKFNELIQKHCSNNRNFLFQVKETFIEYLLNTYNKILPIQEEPFIKDINQFIQLYKETIFDFYKIEMLQKLFIHTDLFNEQNMKNLATSLLFKDSRIYNIVYKTFINLNETQEKQIEFIINNKKNVTPEQFGILPQYCLNKNTVDQYIDKLSIQSDVENMSISAVVDLLPYERCIEKLKQLEQTKTPIGKLKVIVSCAQKISPSIGYFYECNNLEMKSSIIDADQILSIFSYITICSKIKNIYTHLKIIENFASKNQLKSITGYYYNVILSAIQNVKINQRQSSKTANFS